MFGWILLAVGTYRSGTLSMFHSVTLALMSALPLGVLKGSTFFSIVATAGLCVAFVPLGFKVLRNGPIPRLRTVLSWILIVVAVGTFFYFFGQLG